MEHARSIDRRPILVACLIAAAGVALFCFTTTLWHFGVDGPLTDSIDFRAFYCAGHAIDIGRDPYRVEPVRACERAALLVGGIKGFSEGDVLVAPFPPHVLALFALLARAPYRIAVETWLSCSIAALLLTIVLTAKISGVRPMVAALALTASLGFGSLYFGQSVPVCAAALATAALALRDGRMRLAAGALFVATIEPHVALPAWICAFAFVPSMRRPLMVAALAIVALTLPFGLDRLREYVLEVLPAHGFAEVYDFTDQYGLSPLLYKLGVPIRIALVCGTLSYFVMTGLGAYLGGRLSKRFGDRAFIVLAPAATVLIGGVYLHGHQTAVAIPFAFAILRRLIVAGNVRAAVATAAAIVGLSLPLQILATEPHIVAALPRRTVPPRHDFRVPGPNELIDASYTERMVEIASRDERTDAVAFAWKIPTWIALLIVFVVAVGMRREPL